MNETSAVLIKFKCERCGEEHEILMPTYKITQYINKKELIKFREGIDKYYRHR